MSEEALGAIALAFVPLGAWMIRRSLQTGESVTPWPMGPVTREDSPALYWFDLITYTAILLMGGFAAAKLLF